MDSKLLAQVASGSLRALQQVYPRGKRAAGTIQTCGLLQKQQQPAWALGLQETLSSDPTAAWWDGGTETCYGNSH